MLLVAPRSAHALDLHVQAGFLGPYVSFEPTRPPYEHQQAHLMVYEKEESALLAHDFKYGDAAFAPLHRNLLALEKILSAQEPDVAEHDQPIVQRFDAGAALGSTAFVSQLVSALSDRPATGLTERISEWRAALDDADTATPTPGPNRIEGQPPSIVPLPRSSTRLRKGYQQPHRPPIPLPSELRLLSHNLQKKPIVSSQILRYLKNDFDILFLQEINHVPILPHVYAYSSGTKATIVSNISHDKHSRGEHGSVLVCSPGLSCFVTPLP